MLPVLEATVETAVSEREIPQCNISKVKARSLNEKRAGDEIKVKFFSFTGRHGKTTTHASSKMLRHSVVIMDLNILPVPMSVQHATTADCTRTRQE